YVKQTVLLFLPSLALYWLLDRCAPQPTRRWFVQQLVGGLVFFLVISPMIAWNAKHGWPMLAHTVGHLSGGRGHASEASMGHPAPWLPMTTRSIGGAFGPAFVILGIWASRKAWKQNAPDAPDAPENDRARWRDQVWLACAAWPGALFFVLLSFFKPVVG